MPFVQTYVPLLHVIVAYTAKLAVISPALSYYTVTAFFYCLGPVGLFTLAYALSARIWASAGAALMYSTLSPSAVLLPGIAADMGGVLNPRRLQVLQYYGEGPHISSLTWLAFAAACVYYFWRSPVGGRRRKLLAMLSAALVAATLLTNVIGGVTLFIALGCLCFTQPSARLIRRMASIAMIGAAAYISVCHWLPPSVLQAIRVNSPSVGGDYRFSTRSLEAAIILALGFVLTNLACRWAGVSEPMHFALLFTYVLVGITFSDSYFHTAVLPQPHRYQLELEMGVCLLIAFTLHAVTTASRPATRVTVIGAIAVLCAGQAVHSAKYARGHIQSQDITVTPEYKIAEWANQHVSGGRMFVAGSYGFWFNVFSDVPQLSGGHDTTSPNWVQRIALFSIYSGMNAGARDGEIATLWLKTFGVRAIAVPDPHGHEYYKPFVNPNKFDGVLPIAWQEAGDRIYTVPHRTDSLAHVIPESAIVTTQPVNGLDIAAISKYVAASEDSALPEARLRWANYHNIKIEARMSKGQVLALQVNYHPGWRAAVNGLTGKVLHDGLGFIVLRPACDGPCNVDLTFDGGAEFRITRIVSYGTWMAAGLGLALILASRRWA